MKQKSRSRFVLCVRNDGADDLEPRKVYQILPDRDAAREGYVRVIDESGEDYLYPAGYFVPIRLPVAVAREFVSPPSKALQHEALVGDIAASADIGSGRPNKALQRTAQTARRR